MISPSLSLGHFINVMWASYVESSGFRFEFVCLIDIVICFPLRLVATWVFKSILGFKLLLEEACC